MTVQDLILGQQAVVESINDSVLGVYLLERGVAPGEKICIERVAPMGDPIAIRVSDHLLCLRRKEAASILVYTEQV